MNFNYIDCFINLIVYTNFEHKITLFNMTSLSFFIFCILDQKVLNYIFIFSISNQTSKFKYIQ